MISHTVIGVLHLQITLSHFSMPTYERKEDESFIQSQFETTMNINCERWMDWFHGGLQFQIEHHLIPRLARKNLRYVKEKYIKPFAERHNLTYKEYGFFEAIKDVYHKLKNVACSLFNY
jgi:delta8-fatty-acid desaturase